MIDYEKLKLAHELVSKIPFSKITHIYSNEDGSSFTLTSPDLSFRYIFNIDELIEKLQELKKLEPKYKVGDTVFVRHIDSIHFFIIDEIIVEDNEFWYINYCNSGAFQDDQHEFNQYKENLLFPTREALIKSQINYWQSLLCDEILASSSR